MASIGQTQMHYALQLVRIIERFGFSCFMQLMVAATLVLLCTKPPEVAIFGQVPWLLTVPAIAIIGREVI